MNIRKGKTIHLRWPILTNGAAVSLEGRDLSLILACGMILDRRSVTFSTTGNVIEATIQGTDIHYAGIYRLTLYENKDGENQTVVDTDAFRIVERTEDECHHLRPCHQSEGLDIESVNLCPGRLEVFCGSSMPDDVKQGAERYLARKFDHEVLTDVQTAWDDWFGIEVNLYNERHYPHDAKAVVTFDWQESTVTHPFMLSVFDEDSRGYKNVAEITPGDGPVTIDISSTIDAKYFDRDDDGRRLVAKVEIYSSLVSRMESSIARLADRVSQLEK